MKFRKKPVDIEAFKWTGGLEQKEDPEWIVEAIGNGTVKIIKEPYLHMTLLTNYGLVEAEPGDYIIKQIDGEIYPCEADIFHKTYMMIGKCNKCGHNYRLDYNDLTETWHGKCCGAFVNKEG